ncbi:RIB43A-like with coiled-coils protein 2 [Halichoeres trimaculatus]|uniref:RIB43A-like with coiled-coils protein 2 n=1 Tax=Halichoeres trimaculatus TaxID=147232 RepID=UPI003D9F07DF
MFNPESDRNARASLERRRNNEAERRERIFNHKVRTIGVDLEALDLQIKEKKKQEEAAKEERSAYVHEMLHNNKVANILHRRQVEQKHAMEKAIVSYRQQYQSDPNPNRSQVDLGEAQMMLPGLAGEDPGSESRRQRQKEQLRGWLLQQQSEQAQERRRQKLEEERDYQSRVEMANRALQLHSLDAERRRAAALATKEFNLAKVEEKESRQKMDLTEDSQVNTVNHLHGQQTGEDPPPTQGTVEGSAFQTADDKRASVESLKQFQKHQIEEKKRIELQRKQEEERLERVRLDSARAALLMERQQARLDKQLRRHLDSTNVQLAQIHKLQKPDVERGSIDESFFSQFNTCSR